MRYLYLILCFTALASNADESWKTDNPIFTPGPKGSFDSVSVKDPSIVYGDGQWRLFYTAHDENEYSIGYAHAPTLIDLNQSERFQLKQLRGKDSSYAAAPQAFFFRPQKKWYLIFQTRDTNYQPVYSTTKNMGDPASWSAPKNLAAKNESAKWIDFWVICDDANAYMFYTRDHRDVYIQSTSLTDFPQGFSQPRKIFSTVHEAVHVYRVSEPQNEYWMIYEMGPGKRRFGLATAKALDGPWTNVTDRFATGETLQYLNGAAPWTDEVSHGEAIRLGNDERLTIDASNLQLLIQGLRDDEHNGPYPMLPWRLGVIGRTK